MGKSTKQGFIKQGKIVILLAGRYAGKKAIVVKTFDEGQKKRNFGHCLVAGISKAPLAVTKNQSKKTIERRSRVKAFAKFVNYTHIMPTRYNASDIDLKAIVTPEKVDETRKPAAPTGKEADVHATGRQEVVRNIRKAFEARYLEKAAAASKSASGVSYFFQKLRF